MVEITFQNPEYIWFLLSIPLVVATHFFFLKRSRNKALKFANFEAIKRVTGKNLITKNILLLTIRVLILLTVIFAVSGAVLWYEGDSNKNDFVIALDVSASMTAEDLTPNRLEAAKEHAKKFIDSLRNDARVGLITFSGVTFVNKAPTKNHGLIKDMIDELEITKAGGTDIPGAIITSANLLADSDKGKTMIMITDGSSTIGIFVEDSILESIGYAQDNHLLVHTIGVGVESEEPIGYIPEYYNISSVYNENNLKLISSETGGTYYHATDNEKLIEAYKEIAENVDKAWLNVNLSLGMMLVALALLFFEWGLSNTKYRVIP